MYPYGKFANDVDFMDTIVAVATSGGLVIINQNNMQNQYVTKADYDILTNDVRNCIFDSLGNVFFSVEYKVYKFNRELNSIEVVPINDYIIDMEFDDDGILWASNSYYIYRYDGITTEVYENFYDEVNGISFYGSIEGITVDNLGNLWFYSISSLAKFDGISYTIFNSTNVPIPEYADIILMETDSENNPWIYYSDFNNNTYGLLNFDGAIWTEYNSINSPIPDPLYSPILDIEKDNFGNLWFNTYPLIEFDGTNWYEHPNPGPVNVNNLVFDPENNKWFYTITGIYKNDGVSTVEINTSQYDIPGWITTSIYIDDENNKWVGTSNGLLVFNETSWDVSLIEQYGSGVIPKITEDHHGNKWLIHGNKIIRIDPDNNWFIKNADDIPGISFGISEAAEIVCDSVNDIVWFGGGTIASYLIRYYNGIYTAFTYPNSTFLGSTINDLDVDQNGNVWLATYSYGIVKFDGINQWTTFNTENSNIQSNQVKSLSIDKFGIIWYSLGDYESGFGRFDGVNFFDFYAMPNSYMFNDIEFDAYGNTWLLSYTTGLYRYCHDSYEVFNIENSKNSMFALWDVTIDNANSDLWIAGEYGFEKFHPDLKATPDSITLSGKVYLDQNSNGIFDENEPPLSGKMVRILPDSTISFTNSQGIYNFQVDTGSYSITFVNDPYWVLMSLPTTHEVIPDSNFMNGFDFGLHGASDQVNFATDMVCLDPSRCDSEAAFIYSARNDGTVSANASIHLRFNNPLIVQSIYPPASNIIDDEYILEFSDVLPGALIQVSIIAAMPDFSFMGDTVSVNYSINATNNDLSLEFNSSDTLAEIITCSYDPNDKSVESSSAHPDFYTMVYDTLCYTIRFQNTGNDTALNVVIEDMLDYNLDLNTFEFVSSSHDVIVDLKPNHELRFIFNDIMLPDSVVNEPLSHGFVKYKISPKSNTVENSVIRNTAAIYFDNNPAVMTNTTNNLIFYDIPLTVTDYNDIEGGIITVFPNPFDEEAEIRIANPENLLYEIKVYDLIGNLISLDYFSTSTYKVYKNNLKSGMYFFNISNLESKVSFAGKFIVQ
jgi:uncharacterized repeat protein (TIGR01451 family)